ncbi:hypothetical protein DdX_19046 [Ditylenchus destructor]|uniref:Uncharacterized protein n=1 Tax=Ditylenchus destructor TaxID=166010 RepID=A0AAD4MIH5_9BILA|nr:hypothetical protein DdX_19046 [Ditylenchus destructor]
MNSKAKELLINICAEIKEAVLSNDSFQTTLSKIDQLHAALQNETTNKIAATENCVNASIDDQTKLQHERPEKTRSL